MNHQIITTSSMIQNRDTQPLQSNAVAAANTKEHHFIGTLQVLLTAITMLFSLGINGAWADTTVLWNFSDTNWAAGTAKDGLTPGSEVTFTDNSKSIDGYRFTKRLQLGGTMSANKNVSFAVTGACTIKVYGMSGTKDASRTLKITSGTYNGTNVTTNFLSNDGNAIGSDTYNYTGGAATLFIGSENSGYNLYAIKVTYADAPTTIPQTATWNFCEAGSAITAVGTAEGSSKVYPSDITGVTLSVDATSGKFAPRGTDVQVGAGTIIKIPVVNEADVITITNYSESANNATYTIGEEEGQISAQSKTYSPSATEVAAGYVVMTITETGGGYMRSISVVQNIPAGGDPELSINKTATTLTARPLSKTVTDNVKVTGMNLTAGTVITPALSSAVTGFSISPASATVAEDGTLDQTFTITYAATADASESQVTYTFNDATDDKSVSCAVTYSATTTQTAQTSVSEATTWTWNDIYKQQIELANITNPSINWTTEINFADLYPYVNTNANFKASALLVKSNYPVYGNSSSAYFHGNQIKFTTTVAGKVKITKFASGGGDARTITINGTNVGSSTGTSDYITIATEVPVEAGEVTILGSNEVRIWEIVFTPSAPAVEIPTFSLTEEQTVISNKTPDGWTAVQLPQIPEITESNATVVSGLVEGADNTTTLQAALDAVPAEGGMVIIPEGEWLSGPLTMKSKTVLHLCKNTTLKMLPYGTYPQNKDACLITTTASVGSSDVVIEGEDYTSIIDGQGVDWWNALESNSSLVRPSGIIRFNKGTRYLVRNLLLQNAPNTNLQLGNSGNASHFTVHDVKIVNPASEDTEATADGFSCNSHNTDGIPVWGPYCNIYKCNISTGDDNVVFDSNSQYGHVWDCDFGRGHGASIGSYTVNVHDILWDNIRFNGTESGFKVKSQRKDLKGGRSGDVYNITAQNSTMTNVRDILYLDCWYDQSTKPTPGAELEAAAPAKDETTPAFRDITFKNITATNCVYKSSAKNGFPIYFYGLPESHIKNVTLDNVTIEGQKGMFMAYVGENDAEGVTFQNGCNITNVKEPSAAAFVQDYSAVHNDDYVTAAEPLSSEKKLLQAKFSNGFDAFIKEDAKTVTAYYLKGETAPTLDVKRQSDKATTTIVGNTITVTAEDGSTQDYALTLTEVEPLAVTADIAETTFAGNEAWIKTGNTWEATKGWKFAKNADDGRIQDGRTRIYFFVAKSSNVKLINTGVTSDRNIEVYVNGQKDAGITKIGKYANETPAYIEINTSSIDGPAMIAIISNQTGGDGGFTKYQVTAPEAPAGDIVLYDLKTSVGSAEVTAADATITAATSLVLSNTAGRIKITPKDGEKFKNGDKVEFSGTIGNTSKDYGLKIFAADGTTSAGELKVAGTTSPLKVSGTLTLSADADYIFIGRSGGTTTTMTEMTITRPGSAPVPSRTFKDFEIDLTKNPVGDLPEGVTQVSYPQNGVAYNDATHGWMWYAVKFDVDGPVKITLGGCQYTNVGYEAYVTDNTDAKVLDIPTKTAGKCENVTGIYNVEGDNTLTVYCGQYCTGIKVEACDYIPQVTVKYYDVDKTTLLETEVVDGSSALAYNASAVGKVTVADGKRYRGFWRNKANNNRVAEGFTLNEDIDLYPSVTDIETPTKTSEHTLNLVAAGFEMDEHDLISVSGGSMNAQHGWQLAQDQYMSVNVAGNATITVGLCQYAGGGDLVLQDASGNEVSRVAAKVTSDGATHTFIYEGEAGTLKLLATANSTYLHSIKITHTGDLTLPKWDGEKKAWTFATKATEQLNAQELLYAISYVNGQTEHDKTLFIPNGTYDLGTAHNTSIPAGMHLIGQSQDGVLIKNKPTEESINATATFQIDGAGVTLENMTIKCRAPYTAGDGHNAERGVCVEDCGNGSHYKNVTLDGLQDTYYSNGAAGMTATFDNCIVRGNVDFFCGNGDITVNNSRLQIVTTHTSGGTAIICAPATYTNGETQGYVFNNCVVEAATSEVGCLTSGHSSNLRFNLARAWYAGGSSTMGLDRTPRATFTDTEFEIKQAADWGGSIGYAQSEERRIFNIVKTGVDFSDEAMVIDKTNKPFAYATANDRKDPASVSASNITGGGEYDLETIMEKMEAGDGYTVGETKTIDGHKAIVLRSANTVETVDDKKKETRVPMDNAILNAITNNDIIVLDGSGTSTDFVLSQYIRLSHVDNKTIVGINGARLCTEWYLTDYFKSILENVPTSSGTGVNSASTAEGTGGSIEVIRNGKPYTDNIKEEGEYLTRKYLLEATGDKTEAYRNSGIFYIDHSSNIIIRNFKFVGPGSLDCAGYDLMAIIDDTHHCWVDHCEFIDGMDGNFDITNRSDFVTVSWCQFRYTDRSYAHQNTNLVGSSDDKTDDRNKLNITFAYNEWGANCRARMPMARFGRIHMLNNYYNCAGNSEYAMNPRKESEFLVEGNYWEKGVRRAYNPNGQKAVTWGSNNFYADKAAANAGSSNGDFTVTVPYQYSSLMLDPQKVPEVITLNGGAKLYQKPYFTTNLGVVDTDKTAPYEYTAVLSECEADGLVFSVWAENAHTFQWYKQDVNLDGTTGEWAMIDGASRNTYTYMPKTGVTFNIKCKAFGVSGETESDVLKVTIDGESKPIYITDLDDTKTVEVVSGSPKILTVNAGTNGVTYQWYKSANADGSSATAIPRATDRSYTYNPTATTGEVVYLFCRATNQQGDTDSKIVKVKGIYRNVKFHMYATYDANDDNSSLYVVGCDSHNINNVGTTSANITGDSDGCKAEVSRTKDISGLRFENISTSTHTNPLGISAHFVPTTAIANGDKIEVSINTSSTSSANANYGFYVCKAAELGTENANVIGIITVNGNALKTQAFTAVETITDLYLIPFVGGTAKNINLANVVVYSGAEVRPVDDPVFITDLGEEYKVKVGQRQTLSVEVDENDVQSYQWYKNSTKTTDGATAIDGATSASYEYTAAAEGTEYIYCVVTGKKPDTSITSTIATVTATAASDKEPLIWLFDDYCRDNSIAAGGNANIARKVTQVVSTCNGQELKYVTADNSESRVYNLSNSPVTVDDVTYNSYLYMGGSGKVNDRAFVTPALSGSGTLTIIYHDTAAGTLKIYDNADTSADPIATATPVKSSAVEIKLKNLNETELQLVHDAKSYFLGIIWTPNQSVVLEKGIYNTTFADWTTDKTATDNTGRTSNTTITQEIKTKSNETITFTLNNCAVDKEAYYKIKEQTGLTTVGCVVAMKSNDTYNGTITSTTFDNITKIRFVESVSGTNRGMGLKVKGTKEDGTTDTDWVVISDAKVETGNAREVTVDVNRTNVQIQFYNLVSNQYGGLTDLTIYGMMELMNCEEPTYEEAWSGDENEKWVYDFTSTTETANLKYKIDDGAEQTIAAATGKISVNPGQKISIWAIDTEELLPNSPIVEVTAPAKKATTTPNLFVDVYDVEHHNYPVTIDGADDGASIYYTIDGSEPTASSILYTGAFTVGQEVTVKAIAVRNHYANSPILTYTTVAISLPQSETFKTTGVGGNDNEAKGIKNILNPAEIDGKYISGIDGKTGLKYTINGNTDLKDTDGTTPIKGIQIDVHSGYVVTGLNFADTYCNTSSKNIKLSRVFVDGVAIPGFVAKTIPNSPKSNFKIEGIAATESIVLEIIPDADVNQARAAISPVYEFVETPVSATVDGVAFTEEQNNALKNDHVVAIDDKLFAENPVIVVTTDKGYEYTLKEDPTGTDGDYTRFLKKFVGQEYLVKVKVNATKSPYITIDDKLSLAGGYKVTLTGIDYTKTTPYINIDGKVDANGDLVWEEYDKDKSYYALSGVKTRSGYTDDQSNVLYTDPRSANCPTNSYTAGKPFAVYLYVNGYSDNQVGTHAYNNESFKTDKIYGAIANQFNVIPIAVDNSKEILSYRSDITDAKLVVITETLGGSGSVEIEGVGNKSNMLALTLKRDVLDKTNVLNLKMFLNSSSSANNQRWQWAQPRAMASELTSIMPCTPDGGGMYEIFGNATMSRDASINLWDDISTENMLYHLQPVFNFNEDNETRPNFTPLALVIDPEEPEDEREDYHAIHFYKKGDYQYVGFGLSINEWTQYNNNVYAIIDKIGEMIKAGKDLDSKLTGIVKPTVTDNGDGSANVFNNNPNADTYYVLYTEEEVTGQSFVQPSANDIIANGTKANDTDFQTQKFTEKMHIFAVSKLGEAKSEVVPGTVEGNSIRYVIRENDDPAAQGMVAKYPFDLNVNSGTFTMPYNQSWKKDGYTVKEWEVTKSSDPSLTSGTRIKPGTSVSGLTQDITVKAIWSENTFNITDLSKTEDKAARTVTWEFLQSKGAPALAMESKAGNMQAILVGQAKFRRDSENKEKVTDWIDVPMTINTDNLATLPDNGTEYHGKFNNTSTNWAKTLTDGDKEYTGSDYAQVRTGTQFTFPAVYGMNVVYKQVDLVEAVNGEANGNVNRSQVSQSYLTDGTKTADVLNNWKFVNPGFQLDANGKVVMVDGKAQLAKTSDMYEAFKAKGQALGLYDEENGGNHVNGGLIYYTGDGTEATMTSTESAQYIHVGATTGKTLGGLNNGSVFMQSLSVVYPELYDLTCTWNPAKSELDPEEDPEKKENPGKIEKLNDPRPNCGGRYVLNDDIKLKLTPAYGYYVGVDEVDDPATEDVDETYNFLMDGDKQIDYVGEHHIYRYKDSDYNSYSDDIKANIPEDGAYITMKVQDIDLVVSMKKWPTLKYNVEPYPSTQGYITFNSGNGRPHEDEYEEFPVGKKLYVTAHPNTGYKFKEWRRKKNEGLGEKLVSQAEYDDLVGDKTDYYALPASVTFGDGVMVNPFDKNDYLETNELMFIAGTDNHGYNDSHEDNFTYVAVFEKAVTGTGYYEFDYALLKTEEGQAHSEMEHITVSKEDKNQFPSEFTSQLLNFPKYYTLFKPGYTLDHWVEISGTDTGEGEEHEFTPTEVDGTYQFGKPYNPGSYYNFATEGEVKHLVPVFKKNPTSYDYRATPVDITWDLRVAQRAQRVNFKSGTSGNTAADTKIYYSTHATINGDVLIDVPLTITLGKKGKLVNDIEEEDKWCAMGEGTTIVIPSGLGAKFTVASLSKMETTTIDGVVPTSYTVENIDGADVYLYTFTTQSEATSVTLKIGDDYTYYKYIRAELPAADAVPLTTTENNPAFGTVEIAKARTTADAVGANNTALLAKINATRTELKDGQGEAYTLGLGTIVSLHAKRTHLYVLDYFEDGEGYKYYYNKDDETKHLTVKDKDGKDVTAAATAADEYLKMEKVQDFNTVTSLNDLQLTFQVQSYSESMHAVYKENTLYQVNYTSGEEAEGEAPGMTLVEDGESFTIPAENHHLYLDGQTLRYWMDEDGNKYDLGQSYTLGQTFTASKDLPSGIASGKGFEVPKKDIFLTPVFKVNDFTVMNLSQTATAKWPLSRKGGNGYVGNGDIVINFEGINGIYVTPLKVTDAGGNVIDFIDLKMDIRGENGKANNVNSTDRCQVNSGTVFGLPSSSNCTFTLKSANSSIAAKIDGATVEGQQTVSSNYTGDKTQIDVNFTGNTYLYEVVAQYKPVTTDLPELDYATVGNISLGALGTPLAGVKLSTLKSAGEVSGVPADLSNSTTGIMPVVRGTATRGGYVDVTQATIDNPTATMLVKTRDGVTVSVYKIGFDVTYPSIAPRVTDLKIDRKFQCDLKAMYAAAITDTRVDGTNYLNDDKYLRHLGVDGDKADNERVAINGVINIKFSTKMAETTLPAATFTANNGKATLDQAVYALEGQTLTFTYKGLAVNTEYDFIIPAGTLKDVFWAESADADKAKHVYNEAIRIHFTTVENAISTDRRVINYVVTHNQASHFDVEKAMMVADGEPVQVASDELIKNLEDVGIEHGTLDRGVELANAYKESGKRFYIFVPDGEYQLMGNDFVKSVSSPIGEDGKVISALNGKANVYNGITTVSHDNVSITGQSQEKTIVYNHPAFEGLSNASTLKLNNGIANFYAQDMTLQNRFDFLRCRKVSSKAVAPVLWDRSSKPIFKNVKFDSYQDTYYTNANSQLDDTRGYAEDCTIMGYVDFICGDGDDWFQNCNMVVRQGVGSTATNMFAPRQYDTQKWGYVMNKCTFSAENNTAFEVNNGKMTIARPWANSPAETLIECKYDVLSTDDGYKKMTGGGLIMRMQEYKSYNSDGTILDLSKRSLRNSTPGIGSYDAVMTPSKAAEYNLFDVMGGEDGYDPTLYTAQVNMPKTNGIKQDDTFLTWDDQKQALCYFIFTSDTENGEYKLFAVTDGTEFEMGNAQINKWFYVRAANQRGGLGEPTDVFQYKAHESYKRELVNNTQVIDGWRWSTIYLDFDAKAPVVQHEEMVDGEMKTVDDIYVYALVKVDATKLTFKRVKIMEKNCGYLIKARPRPEEYEFKYTEKTPVYWNGMTVPEYEQWRTEQSGEEVNMPHMSLMNGSVIDKATAGTAGYTLASKTSYGLGFYKFVGKQYNANFAWLDAALVAEAQKALAEQSFDNGETQAAKAGYMRMVFEDDFIDDNATDIDAVYDRDDSENLLDENIYTLGGQRIDASHMRHGQIYIIRGQKMRY